MLFKSKIATENIAETNFEAKDIERHALNYEDCSKRFYQVSRDFSKQYAHIYASRLNTFRNILTEIARKRWSNKYKVLKLCELRDKSKCIVIGTLFKHQELKPSILKELSDQLDIIPPPPRTHFVHDSDSLVLEDELQRIKISGNLIDVHQVVTGVVCAVLGSEDEDGVFQVEDVCWSGCNIQKPLPKLEDDRYIVLMSGLNMSSKLADHWFPLHLFLEWLAGVSGTTSYQEELSKIVRVVVAGGTFTSYSTERTLNEADAIDSIQTVDSFCSTVSAVAPLDLMPGCRDPTGIMLPQKPFHYCKYFRLAPLDLMPVSRDLTGFILPQKPYYYCLFPKAVEYKSFNRVSNPYECDVGGYLCLGTSGEPIKDIMRYSKIDNYLDAMRLTLQWRHLAPTCPDTVPTMPCLETDPFVIYSCPAVYFCGNAEKFDTALYDGGDGQKLRLVCVPEFYSTKTVAVVNLKNLDCYSMSFT